MISEIFDFFNLRDIFTKQILHNKAIDIEVEVKDFYHNLSLSNIFF